jgi:hypothetical protein
VIHRIDERLLAEVRRYSLAFTCDRCAQFDPAGERCSLGVPIEPHRDARLEGRDEVTFCKSFELC